MAWRKKQIVPINYSFVYYLILFICLFTFVCSITLFIYLFIYYMVYTHVESFTIVKNRKCGQVTSHCRKARSYRADLSLFLNVPVVTVTLTEDERDRLVQVLEPATVRGQRGRRAPRDRLAHGNVRQRATSVRLRETPHRRNIRREPRTLPVPLRHTGRNARPNLTASVCCAFDG